VTWDQITSEMVAETGWFTVHGAVAGTSVKPSAVVTVAPTRQGG
jgi:hypothetical protein